MVMRMMRMFGDWDKKSQDVAAVSSHHCVSDPGLGEGNAVASLTEFIAPVHRLLSLFSTRPLIPVHTL
jgi:hypothetical protein